MSAKYITCEYTTTISALSIQVNDRYTLDECGRIHSFDDQPAIITPCGSCWWAQNGLLHREFGPAIMIDPRSAEYRPFRGGYWYLHGLEVDPIEVLQLMLLNKRDITEYLFSEGPEVRSAASELLGAKK